MNCNGERDQARLEESGLIARQPGDGGRRREMITPTRHGVATRSKLTDAVPGCSPPASPSLRDQRPLSDLLTRAGADPELPCRATSARPGPA
jgi:DNA-binding MarR family transcriptional regulator